MGRKRTAKEKCRVALGDGANIASDTGFYGVVIEVEECNWSWSCYWRFCLKPQDILNEFGSIGRVPFGARAALKNEGIIHGEPLGVKG